MPITKLQQISRNNMKRLNPSLIKSLPKQIRRKPLRILKRQPKKLRRKSKMRRSLNQQANPKAPKLKLN